MKINEKDIHVETTTLFFSWHKCLPSVIRNPSKCWHVYVYMSSYPLYRPTHIQHLIRYQIPSLWFKHALLLFVFLWTCWYSPFHLLIIHVCPFILPRLLPSVQVDWLLWGDCGCGGLWESGWLQPALHWVLWSSHRRVEITGQTTWVHQVRVCCLRPP